MVLERIRTLLNEHDAGIGKRELERKPLEILTVAEHEPGERREVPGFFELSVRA